MGEGEVPDVHTVAGVGKIIKKMDLPDNRYFILVKGIGTVDITSELESERYIDKYVPRFASSLMKPFQWKVKVRSVFSKVVCCAAPIRSSN